MTIDKTCLIFLSCCWLAACGLHRSPNTAADDAKAGMQTGQLSIVQKLKEFDHLPVGERIALYYQLKKEQPGTYNFKNEDELTMYGYGYLWSGNVAEAIAIFKLIVAEFPDSSNPYDSLGEAYLKNGDNELALANYQKSLRSIPIISMPKIRSI